MIPGGRFHVFTFSTRSTVQSVLLTGAMVLAGAWAPSLGAQEPEAPEVAAPIDEPLEDAPQRPPIADSEPANPSAATQPQPAGWDLRRSKNTPKFLGLVGLLLLWLLARSEARRQSAGVPQRPTRHAPISPDELGHAAFHAALDADLDEYRGLFLTGPEAANVLGPDAAEAYLGRRSLRVLEDALADFAARIPPGAHFDHAAMDGDDLCLITLRLDDDSKATLPLGSVSRVGRILRLREPAVGGRFSH